MSDTNGNGSKLRAIADSVALRLAAGTFSIVGLPLISYMLLSMQTLQNRNAAYEERFMRIESELSLRTVLRYTSEDARRDRENTDNQITEIRRRLDLMDRRP